MEGINCDKALPFEPSHPITPLRWTFSDMSMLRLCRSSLNTGVSGITSDELLNFPIFTVKYTFLLIVKYFKKYCSVMKRILSFMLSFAYLVLSGCASDSETGDRVKDFSHGGGGAGMYEDGNDVTYDTGMLQDNGGYPRFGITPADVAARERRQEEETREMERRWKKLLCRRSSGGAPVGTALSQLRKNLYERGQRRCGRA
ncbi:hypothetical protein [Chelativorans salis]|uniref:Lipoprotein n=1 Tax=Chelativorans salis TaxID=2978478 RepID=A0ABT2LQA8_9HYPH|nr:hypothetical protein [Chelativorans sp. EGI FJ00035]MCT7376516.1 hypothetical protein [Chelativorans sp. EGI FJ00035]